MKKKATKTMKPTMPRLASKAAPDMSVVPQTILEAPTKVRKGKIKPVGKKKPKVTPVKGPKAGKKGSGAEFGVI